MGSFHVTCGLTGVTIGEGNRVALLPLISTSGGSPKPLLMTNSATIQSPNENFTPFCLPIFGEYDEYGCLYNVKVDDNTKAIESFFGFSIDTFIACLTTGLSFSNLRHPISEIYQIEEVDLRNPTTDTLLQMGLIEVGTGLYLYEPERMYVSIEESNGGTLFSIRDSSDTGVKPLSSGNYQLDLAPFLDSFYSLTGVMLHIRPEKRVKAQLLYTMSGMFMHEDAYSLLSEKPSSTSYQPYDALTLRFRLLDEEEKKRKRDHEFEAVKAFLPLREDTLLDLFRHLYFLPLYKKHAFLGGELRDEFAAFFTFNSGMYRHSKTYFPTFCGPQYGDPKATARLLELSNRLNQKALDAERNLSFEHE